MDKNNIVRKIVMEELSKSDVRAMIDSKMDDYLKEKAFRKKVREIASDVLDDFFKEMWHKKGFWKNTIRNG